MSARELRIYSLLQRTAHRLKIKADTALNKAGGLTTAQAATMAIIASKGPVPQRVVAEALSQRESAMTAMAARLFKAGYIKKTRSTDDARIWQLEATDEGRKALERMREPFDRINAVLDDSFEGEDMERLARALQTLLDKLEN
tara:strand:- start:1 stop:429 length:429 start_codon:yes stop_codon:yes gene_type:complete